MCPSEQDIPQEVDEGVMNHVMGGIREGVKVLGKKRIGFAQIAGDGSAKKGEDGNVQQLNGYRMSPSKMSESLTYHNMRDIQARS